MGADVARQRVALGLRQLGRGARLRRVDTYPLGRVGTVADVVETILFLLSDSSAWISGESINIDGGSLAG